MSVTTRDSDLVTREPMGLAACRGQHASPRKVLGELSTNTQLTPKATIPAQSKKSMTVQPLKRSFGADFDDSGFMYLKRRRLSYSGVVAESTERVHEHDSTAHVGLMHIPHELGVEADASERASEGDRESSAERHSFSSLINYDPSSQPAPSSQARASALSPNATRANPSHAERLRIRLRMAMYKVQTQQTAVSFEYLREDTTCGSRESDKAVQEAVDQLREEAYAKLAISKKQPAIALTPAAVGQTDLASPQRRHVDEKHLSDTPVSRAAVKVENLTSSAVKGQVAQGLLGLKHGFYVL